MRADGITPFAAVGSSSGSYQVWIQLKSEDKTISSGTWNSIRAYLEGKYGAQKKISNMASSSAFPGFLSYRKDPKGSFAALQLTDGASDIPMKSVADVITEIHKNIKMTSGPDIQAADMSYSTDSWVVAVPPGWFAEKWEDDRSDLINSKRCPKRDDGTPDDSLIDFVVAKNLIAYYSSHRPEVLHERIGYCYGMLAREADDPQRLHRKGDPCGYAGPIQRTV